MNRFLLALLIFQFFSLSTVAQECLTGGCSGGSQYPSATQSSNSNSWSTVSTVIWAGDYAVYNVTSGSTYQWSLCTANGGSASYDAELTLLNSSGATKLCYSDDVCGDDPTIQWTATFTGTVRVLVTQFGCVTNTTSTTLVWRCSSCGSGSAPANDNCSGATTLTVGSSCSNTAGTVSGATNSNVTPQVGTADDDVWYKFTTTTAGYYSVRVDGSTNFDAVLEIRSGACDGSYLAYADNSVSDGIEFLNVNLAASTTYYVRVYHYYAGIPASLTFNICVYKPSTCEPYYSTGTSDGDFIDRVQLTGISSIDNTPAGTGSTGGASYNDYYSTVSNTIQAGTSQTLTVTVGAYGGQNVATWIDYNADGDFSDAGESLGEVANVAASGIATFNFTVPSATSAGAKRLRIRTVYGETGLDACATYSFGEAEDYKINVTAACVTPGTPPTPTSSSVTESGATFSWAAESPVGSTTVTYSWALGTSSGITYESGYLQRGTTTSPTRSVALTGLNPGTVYFLVVKASTSCNSTVSAYSIAGTCTTSCITPATPTSLTNSNISTTSATISWTASASGSPTITYYWAINTSSTVNYETNYIQRGTTTSLSVPISGLTSSTNYTWTVKAVTNCGSGSASAYASTKALATNSACTTPSTPTLVAATNISASSATINWNASGSGSPTITYYWALNTSSTVDYESNYILQGTTTSLSVNVSGLSNATTYYYKVKAVTSCNNTASAYQGAASSFTTTCTTPGTPASLSTSNITNSSVTANWNASSGSPNITYSWAINSGASVDFSTNFVQVGVTSGTSVVISGLTSNTAYKWTVKAVTSCDATESAAATAVNCTTSVSCSTPSVPASLTATNIANTSATINWAASTGSPTITYSWAVGTGSNVTYESNYTMRGVTTSLSAPVSGLSSNTIYYYTIKASTSCNNTVSSYAIANNFTTICTTPSTPSIIGASSISTTSATLSWSASSGSPTITYYWAVGTAANVTYESGYTERGTTTSTSATSSTLNSNTTYYWTVKAVTSCDVSVSTYPISASFTTPAIPTPLIIWDGSSSTDWQTAANWTPAQVPTINDNVEIPSGCPNYPVISAGGLCVNTAPGGSYVNICKSLHITSSTASVRVASTLDVRINGVFNIAGQFHHHPSTSSMIFNINSGGIVTVKNGGYLNIGSSQISSGVPAGTIQENSDVLISDGTLTIENGGKAFIMDDLRMTGTASIKGKLNIDGGDLYIKYYGDGNGDGSTISYGFDLYSNAVVNMTNGNIYVCGQDKDNASAHALDWNANAIINITGGTFNFINEQSSGTNNTDNIKIDLQNKTLYNIVHNRTGKTSLIKSGFNLLGDITNNAGTLTQDAGTAILSGSNNTIGGSALITFNNLTIPSGAAYTLNNSFTYATVSGSFSLNSGGVFNTLGSNMALNLAGTTNTIAGTYNASNAFDGTRDLAFNNAGATFSVTGNLNADVQVSSGTTTLNTSCTINGDVLANTGTLTFANGITVNLNGSFTNNGTFNSGTGTIQFNGTGNSISGTTNNTAFNNLIFPAGSNYTWNPGSASGDNFDVNGSFTNNGTIIIAANRFIDIYSSTASSESITLNGTITSLSPNDNARDIDINNTVNLSGNGTITADIRIFDNTTTLTSDLATTGDFLMNNGTGPVFTMTTHTFTVGGSWIAEGGTFNCGTGTVVFNGIDDRDLKTGSGQTGGTINSNYFYNVKVNLANGKTLLMDREGVDDATNGLRVQGDLIIESGILSTGGNSYVGRKLRFDKITYIEQNAVLNIGGSSSEVSYGNWVSEVRGDFIIKGSVTTSRPIVSGYAEIFFYGARLTGEGDANELGCDIQTHAPDTLFQIGNLFIQGDLITQSTGIYVCKNQLELTVGGNLYVYNKFWHEGTITCLGHFRDNAPTYTVAVNGLTLTNSVFNFSQTGGTKFVSFDVTNMPTVYFGEVNVLNSASTREFRNNIDCIRDLTVENGATADVTTNNRNITMSESNSSFYNNGSINLRSNTVTFSGSGTQVLGGSSSTTFYNLTVNKSAGSELTLANSQTVTNTLGLTAGFINTTANKLLTLNDNATCSPAGGSTTSYVKGPLKKVGNDAFTFPTGKGSKWARIAISAPATATTTFTGEYFDQKYSNTSALQSPITQVSAKEYWQLDRAVNTDAVTVQLFWEDAGYSGITSCAANGNLVVARFDGTEWVSHGSPSASGTCSGSSAGTISSSSVTSFSPFTFGSKTASENPLPVSWLNFEATPKTNLVLLNWSTGSELNSKLFYIQRSLNGQDFLTMDSVNAVGFATYQTNYSGIDSNPHRGINYYRIKQLDVDGKYSFTNIIPVDFAYYEVSNSITNSLLYPNPTNANVTLGVSSQINQTAQLTIFSLEGRIILNKNMMLESGQNNVLIESENLPAGIYIVNLNVNGQKISHKLVKQ